MIHPDMESRDFKEATMPPIWQLLYRSEQAYEMDTSDLMKLLFDARTFNRDNGITGLLLYRDGHFMQLLEGEEPMLRLLYGWIAADPRHRNPVLEIDAPARERLFPEWKMGYAEAPRIEGRAALYGTESEHEALEILGAMAHDHDCAQRLMTFIENNSHGDASSESRCCDNPPREGVRNE
jgi:Sensors of blue-light using FAD